MKTQCTKKERGTGALKDLMELAGAIDQFAYEYDTCKYMDQVDDSEEHVLSIMNDLKKGNTEKLASYFKSIMEDHKAFVKKAEDILAQIEGLASGQKTASESGNADSGSGKDSHSDSAVIGGNNKGNHNLGANNVGDWNTGDYNTGNSNKGNHNVGSHNDGNGNVGDNNMGYSNTGHCNEGSFNTGNDNKGNRNVGNNNTGGYNTGYFNEGKYNAGNKNEGNSNTGHHNEGDGNTGSWNIGDHNTGDWNKGYRNTGIFCTLKDPTVMLFNRESSMTYEEWLDSKACSIMSFCPSRASNRQNWWNKLYKNEQSAIMELPNFDAGIFREITGIDVNS
jgi:hypothetical protein